MFHDPLLISLFLRIFLEIENLKENVVKVDISKF